VAHPHLIGDPEAAPLENGEVEAKTAFLVYRSRGRAQYKQRVEGQEVHDRA
jgi:hypothetical protein